MTSGEDLRGAERELLRHVEEGCETSFRRLYRIHTGPLYRMALRLTGGNRADAEEVVQETWRRAVSRASAFEGRSPLRSWLLGIAARVGHEHARKRKRNEGGDQPGQPSAIEAAVAGTARAGTASRIDLERAVADLAPGYRAVLVLHDIEGYPHEEIGRMLGISPGTSKSQLSRARTRVRQSLGDDYASE